MDLGFHTTFPKPCPDWWADGKRHGYRYDQISVAYNPFLDGLAETRAVRRVSFSSPHPITDFSLPAEVLRTGRRPSVRASRDWKELLWLARGSRASGQGIVRRALQPQGLLPSAICLGRGGVVKSGHLPDPTHPSDHFHCAYTNSRHLTSGIWHLAAALESQLLYQ